MVLPNHIEEAERIGVPEDKIEIVRCRQCDAKRKGDEIDKCDSCGRECCNKCWYYIPDIALKFCGKECAITKLLKLLAAAEMTDKPITEHPDVQRLIGQVETLSQENKRLSKRDCNASVQLQIPTADNPFNKEDCCIVDVGVMDNIYVVECAAVVELQAENERLKSQVIDPYGMVVKCKVEITRLQAKLEAYDKALEKLARLGSEPFLGNSIGNVIAQRALKGDSDD